MTYSKRHSPREDIKDTVPREDIKDDRLNFL